MNEIVSQILKLILMIGPFWLKKQDEKARWTLDMQAAIDRYERGKKKPVDMARESARMDDELKQKWKDKWGGGSGKSQ